MSLNVNRLLITALLAWFALQGMGVFHLYPLVQDFSVHGQYCVNSYRKHSQVPFWNSRAFTNFQSHPLENERRTQEWFCLGNKTSRWWFQIFFVFTPLGEMIQFWVIFSRWVETINQTSPCSWCPYQSWGLHHNLQAGNKKNISWCWGSRWDRCGWSSVNVAWDDRDILWITTAAWN